MAQKRSRKNIGKRLRFDVFHRDAFACQYCGKRPPEVILHLDHIVAYSKGGSNEQENLITSCQACNGGKSDKDISNPTPRITQNIEELTERYEQMVEFYKYQKSSERLKSKQVENIDEYWNELWDGRFNLNVRGKSSISMFLNYFTVSEIKEAMFQSSRLQDVSSAFRYMCGILHNKRRERNG